MYGYVKKREGQAMTCADKPPKSVSDPRGGRRMAGVAALSPAHTDAPGADYEPETRTARLWIRLTPTEMALLVDHARAVGMTRSDYLRGQALGAATEPAGSRKLPRNVADLIAALTRVGISLTELARLSSANQAITQHSALEELLGCVRQLIADVGS